MSIADITFPLYKLRAYNKIETNPLGLVKVTSIKGTYVLDDTSIPGTFKERRTKLITQYPGEKIYKLKEQVLYLRQLVKYKSNTTFIDNNGKIFKYKKGDKLYTIKSHKIERRVPKQNWTILRVRGIEIPFLVGHVVPPTTTHASILHSSMGPFLYDLTRMFHEPYKRKI